VGTQLADSFARSGRRELRKAENREKLLCAARRVFARKGLGEATARDIVRETDLATGTFYNYFPDKESVLHALLDEAAAEIRSRVRAARKQSTTMEEFVEGGFRAYYGYMVEDRQTFELLRRNAGTIRSMFDEPTIGAGVQELRDDLEAGIRSGLLPEHDVDYMAAAMVGAALEIGARMLDSEHPDPERATALVSMVFTAGLRAARC
jgi:AcrR family transcriptional regulator